MKGSFIVIDGPDGTGKATQIGLLLKRLRKERIPVSVVDFPQYGKRSAALVEQYLNGKFGTVEDVGPYCAAIFYAVDRFTARDKIRRWLKSGRVVIANRYVSANMAHQGGKIENARERKKFMEWIYELEFGIFELPEPDATIILRVPVHIAQTLIDRKAPRSYLKGKRDIHEKNLRHLQAAENTYKEISSILPNVVPIECVVDNHLLTQEQVHHQIWGLVEKTITT